MILKPSLEFSDRNKIELDAALAQVSEDYRYTVAVHLLGSLLFYIEPDLWLILVTQARNYARMCADAATVTEGETL